MRSYAEAKAYAERQHVNPSQNWYVLCQKFARSCVGADVFGASARLAFNSIPKEHRHTSYPPPPGSLAYYGFADRGFGHVVFVVEDGYVWSNDIVRRGKIDKVKWNVFQSKWGLPYRGWIDWTPSGAINLKPTAVLPYPPFPGKFWAATKRTPAVIAATKAVQKKLKLKVDGVFGPVTGNAVRAYRRRHPHLWPARPVVTASTYKSIMRLK